jgi:hypothetical protein
LKDGWIKNDLDQDLKGFKGWIDKKIDFQWIRPRAMRFMF